MDVQTVAFRSPTTQGLPGPFPATVYAVLLTPWGTPAMPPVSMRLLQGSNGYAHFYNLEPGQYRVWMDVPVGWNPIPGTGPSQYLWIQPNGPNCQALFQYQACSYCPNGGPGRLPPADAARFTLAAFANFAEHLARAGDDALNAAQRALTARFSRHLQGDGVHMDAHVHIVTGARPRS